jgi:hypothetical protein
MSKHKLTQEDIVDLGWYKDTDKLLYTFGKNYELRFYKRVDYKYMVNITHRIDRFYAVPVYSTLFLGIINTKKALRKLMKQLEINV